MATEQETWQSLGGKGIVNAGGERRLWAIECIDDLNTAAQREATEVEAAKAVIGDRNRLIDERDMAQAKAQAAEANMAEALWQRDKAWDERDAERERADRAERELAVLVTQRDRYRDRSRVTDRELDTERELTTALLAALTRWRSLLAEHDLEDLHPLTIVNAIGSMDDAIAQAHAAEVNDRKWAAK